MTLSCISADAVIVLELQAAQGNPSSKAANSLHNNTVLKAKCKNKKNASILVFEF